MKKSDLKSGMVVETRNGKRYLFINNEMLGVDGFLRFSSYYEDLKNKIVKDYDVLKVYKTNQLKSLQNILEDEYLTLIWERKDIELTDKEIEILEALKTLGFEFLARDEDDCLYAYNVKPYKVTHYWDFNLIGELEQSIMVHNDVFRFITWSDEEPTYIDDLLEELEK